MDAHKQIRERIRTSKRIVVKLGTRTLVRKDGRPDHARLKVLVNDIAAAHKAGHEIVVVSSGAIGAGLEALKWTTRPTRLHELQVAAAVGQSRLMALYDQLFRKRGCQVGQVLLTHDGLKERERHLNARRTIHSLLHHGVIPIVNENDVVMVEELRFGDNDLLAALVSILIDADALMLLTTVDGLRAPGANGRTRRIPWLPAVNDEALALTHGKSSHLSTGGMASKLESARMAAEADIPVVIANGRKDGIVGSILTGHSVGTLIGTGTDGLTRRKRWISCFHRTLGTLYIDDGACDALINKGRSLLPIGIQKVEGRFNTGTLVSIRNHKNKAIARGLVEYSSGQIKNIKGLHTKQLRQLGGLFEVDEVVHRDNLIVLEKGATNESA